MPTRIRSLPNATPRPATSETEPSWTGREVAHEAPASWDYIVRPWVAAGMLTELDGKPKSAGKTTLLLHLVRAVLDGRPFLGEPTTASPVVYLTEQSRWSLGPTLATLGLDRDDFHVLAYPDVMGRPWPETAEDAIDHCYRVGARLLIVDTLGQFAGVRGDAENDAGSAHEAMAPLQAAAADGLAIVVSRHDRKGGGDVGESGRGSNAWTGAVDCVIALRRQSNPKRPSASLEAISRRGDVPPEPVLIELEPDGYVVLGSDGAVAFAEARESLRDLMADGEARTERQMLDALGEDVKRTSLQSARDALIDEGVLERLPRDRRSEPYLYVAKRVPSSVVGLRQVRPATNDDGPSDDLVVEPPKIFGIEPIQVAR